MLVILTKQNILGQLPRDGKLAVNRKTPKINNFVISLFTFSYSFNGGQNRSGQSIGRRLR